jgi:hypothetical protein
VIRTPSFEGANQSKEGRRDLKRKAHPATKGPAMPSNYAEFNSRSHHIVIRLYGNAGNVIETHEHKGDFKDW